MNYIVRVNKKVEHLVYTCFQNFLRRSFCRYTLTSRIKILQNIYYISMWVG